MMIAKSSTAIEQTLDVAVDVTAMAKHGSATALKSFNAENHKALKDLQQELGISDEEFEKL